MKEKRAIVTGAGTGIGNGVAKRLAADGYKVVLHYNSSAEGAKAACDEIRSNGGEAWMLQADLSKKAELDSFFDKAFEILGGVDIFVNNSGITKKCTMSDMSEALFDEMMSVDFKSAYFSIQRAANKMAEQGGGSIVVISSNNAFQQRPKLSVYGTVKMALIKLVRHAAMEYAHKKVRVNAIAPGWTATPRVLQEDEQQIFAEIPIRRFCQPDEIGEMVLFLSSECAVSITGNCLVADGGARLVSAPMENYLEH